VSGRLSVYVGGATEAEAVANAEERVRSTDSPERVWVAVPGTYEAGEPEHHSIGLTTQGADGQGYLRAEHWLSWRVYFATERKAEVVA
jgi:hypothetical protein